MKTLFKALTTLVTIGLVLWGTIALYQLNDRLGAEQHAAAFKQCESNSFKGWVKLKGDFNIYLCNAETKTIEII